MKLNDKTIAVIGLGYVGLPLAVEFSKHHNVIGFDINHKRIKELQQGSDHTLECSSVELAQAKHIRYTDQTKELNQAQVFIITVPTPVDLANRPDLSPLISASATVGKSLKKGDVIIYESTVYPGATEEVCIPVLEQNSNLKLNVDFYCGYSPERINPGDKTNKLTTIKKITSGSTPEAAKAIDELYKEIIIAGTYLAESIKVAEAAKVIENTQRDLNIGLMNELSLIFHRIGIDTTEVINAASTKWNFMPFRPGLVGGHCIGVDPYYLTYKAELLGYHPEVILAGRRVNNNIVKHVADETIKLMLRKNINVAGSKILVLGLTFKENCPDLRNTKIVNLINLLNQYNVKIDVFDPWVNLEEAKKEYGIDCLANAPNSSDYAAIILAVAHDSFLQMGSSGIRALGMANAVIYDVKGILPRDEVDGRL